MQIYISLIKKTLCIPLLVIALATAPVTFSDQAQVEVQSVYAGPAGPYALEPTQLFNYAQLIEQLLVMWQELELLMTGNPLQWFTNQDLSRVVTESIVEHAQTGFGGDPTFLRSFAGFQTEVIDFVGIEFINNLETRLNTPFTEDLQIALSDVHQRQMRGTALGFDAGDPEEHLEFLAGDFTMGGWERFYDTISNPGGNTPFGALATAQQLRQMEIQAALDREETKLDWGQGFHTMEECFSTGDGTTICGTETPGTIITKQLDRALGLGIDSAVQADAYGLEFDERLRDSFVRLGERSLTEGLFSFVAGADPSPGFSFEDMLDRIPGDTDLGGRLDERSEERTGDFDSTRDGIREEGDRIYDDTAGNGEEEGESSEEEGVEADPSTEEIDLTEVTDAVTDISDALSRFLEAIGGAGGENGEEGEENEDGEGGNDSGDDGDGGADE